jgi:hypothetical protein
MKRMYAARDGLLTLDRMAARTDVALRGTGCERRTHPISASLITARTVTAPLAPSRWS